MPLSVLTDEQIGGLLEALTLDELDSLRSSLQRALHEYSVGTQDRSAQEDEQPERQAIYSEATGTKTLFMPSRGPAGLGVKVITLTSPPAKPPSQQPSAAGSPVDGKGKEAEAPAPAPAATSAPVIRPTGAITLFSPQGAPVAILHASQLTAFRTALASLCLVHRRSTVKVLTVFGAGLQAYWHVRLALAARGRTVKRVNIISHRYSDSCRDLLRRFLEVPAEVKAREGWQACQFGILTPSYVEYARLLKDQVRAADVVFCCTPSTEELFPAGLLTNTEGRRRGRLLVAIGSYTPDMREIPLEVLRQAVRRHPADRPHFHKHATEGGVVVVDTLDGALKEAGELIAAGLRPDQLVELGELVMLQEAQSREQQGGDEAASDGGGGGLGSGASSPTGFEFDRLDLTPGTPSLSSVFGSPTSRASSRASSPSRKSTAPSTTASSTTATDPGRAAKVLPFLQKRSSSSHSTASERRKKKDDHLAAWLQSGNVIYKSVGLGLMDLAVGMHLVQFAREKGVGTHVDGF
ncbi:hypothetical protein RB597_004362 [Gaeumannomyces tritici]